MACPEILLIFFITDFLMVNVHWFLAQQKLMETFLQYFSALENPTSYISLQIPEFLYSPINDLGIQGVFCLLFHLLLHERIRL